MDPVISIARMQAQFLKRIKHVITSKKKGSFKVSGGFYTQKAMGETLKFTKPGLNILLDGLAKVSLRRSRGLLQEARQQEGFPHQARFVAI